MAGTVPTISITNPELESENLALTAPNTPDSPSVFDIVKTIDHQDWEKEAPLSLDDDYKVTEELEVAEKHVSDDDSDDLNRIETIEYGKGSVESEEDEEAKISRAASATPTPTTIGRTRNVDHPTVITQPVSAPEGSTASETSVAEFYNGKSVLITGATGFIGKAVLWKLLNSLHEPIEKIYLLIRLSGTQRKSNSRPSDRFHQEILSNKAFVNLRRTFGARDFDRLIKEKIQVVIGDLNMPSLGLSDVDRAAIIKNVNVVIHCAANLDGKERLDTATMINTIGTMRLMDLADECAHMKAFIHLSPAQIPSNYSAPPGSPVQERVYPMGMGDPETLLNQTLGMDVEEMTRMTQRVLQFFPNTYLFTKALAEHLLLKRAESKRVHEENGTKMQYPITIMRVSSVGAAVVEPLVGWADSVAGACGAILLIGKGIQPIQASEGDSLADIVPVDYLARLIIGSAAFVKPPGTEFTLPYPEYLPAQVESERPPSLAGSVSNDSTRPPSSIASQGHTRSSSATSRSSRPMSYKLDQTESALFPYIYNVSSRSLDPLNWRDAYDIIRHYWTQGTPAAIPTSQSYFSPPPNAGGLSRARTMMRTLTSMVGGAQTNSFDVVAGVPKRNSQRFSRIVEKASKLSDNSRALARQSVVFLDSNVNPIKALLNQADNRADYSLQDIIPDDAGQTFWKTYLLDASYGIHYYVGMESGLRNNNLPNGWDCAINPRATVLYQEHALHQLVIDRRIRSAVFSQSQISQRSDRMVAQVEGALTKPLAGKKQPQTQAEADATKKHDEEWLTDLDDALEDWCEDVLNRDTRNIAELGRWRNKIGDNDETVKTLVLNDKRVGTSLKQIMQKAGVPQQTGINEALKILLRMRERTQLSYVWFAGSFLKSLLSDMFESVRIREHDIADLRQQIRGKRVVYVPVYKTILDPLLVWYTVIRYQLPVPALACDEYLGALGPLSDVFRLAGAFYIKRDAKARSPLNSAVTAAYTQVLLREHGALAFVLEKARSRTGKPQPSYPDGLVNMILEAALQHNQNRSSQYSMDSDNGPTSPISPASPAPSLDNALGQKDIVFVPINITYEKIPELSILVDEVLDQRPQSQAASLRLPIQGVTRPSEAMDRRQRTLEGNRPTRGRYGRALVGFGQAISVQKMAAEVNSTLKLPVVGELAEDEAMVQKVTKTIQERQREALIISPVGLVAAIILYGRATGGVHLGKLRDLLEWLCSDIKQRGLKLDYNDGQDIDSTIFYAFKVLDEQKNLVIESKEINDETNIRVNDHADNVMTLSYYANQIVDPFLCEAFFSVVYLSFTSSTIAKEEVMDRFRFLVQMFEQEFAIKWDIDQQFNTILKSFVDKGIIKEDSSKPSELIMAVTLETDALQYEQLIFLASLVYPTIDAYWITSCSLSALEAVPSLPRSIVPVLCQWIATHLISGRRTIYREVLSTEASRTAVDVFMALGFVAEIQAKEKLSPDTQMLLHELGISTSETLIELNGQNSDGGATPVSPVDPEGMMRALMAQIQMNRANSNMADLCQQIDSYRLGAASQRESFQNAQVFNKCQKQIKGILRANNDTSFAQRRGQQLSEQEEDMVQLVYALRLGSAQNSAVDASGKSIRRISEAYNLQKSSTP
ncbi:hypothetical protein INT43_006863 [Umbelopsis isabellina]|uniref:Phospholipid/glycerol acyltransferase domain-containing protein n=1 Tax=Mortierella isabellina TaxID=91625 RepID=A0A8H7PX84_MORIS|nr:hypothetical protein INT43_006863 [Umbelopsis isabellina]